MVAAQHMESQWHCITVPHCIASFTKLVFYSAVAFLTHIKHVLALISLAFMTLHTSVSILLLICCTFLCPPCMYEQSLVPVDHPGLDHTRESR